METFTTESNPVGDLLNWRFVSESNLLESSLKPVNTDFLQELAARDVIYELGESQDKLERCVSMDSFSKACLADYRSDQSYTGSTESREYCSGRDLYNNEDMTEFYGRLKKVPDSTAYRKNYLLIDTVAINKPTRMAELLAAQLPTDLPTTEDTNSQEFYGRLKKVPDGTAYRKKYLLIDTVAINKPTRMAELLAAQLPTYLPTTEDTKSEEKKSKGFKLFHCFGRCFSGSRKCAMKDKEVR